MKTFANLAAGAALLLSGCDGQQPTAPVQHNAVEARAPEIVQAPVPGCADGWTAEIDQASFANNGASRTFPASRLAAFRDELTKGVRGAVDAACVARELDPAKAKAMTKLVARSASGADDPIFYAGEQARSVMLEWTFAENDLTIPSEMELRAGLICWSDPQSESCAER
jgi:hypothetical protein